MGDIDINILLNQLDERGKVEFLKRSIGFSKGLVDIYTFVTDPYYLGKSFGINPLTGKPKLFDVWYERLGEVFPNEVTTHTFIVNKGAIGTGKSTFSEVVLIYDYYKFIQCDNPSDYFELTEKACSIKVFNIHKWKAQEMVDNMYAIMERSQYFKDQYENPDSNIHKCYIGAAGRLDDIISGDVIGVLLSELNFVKYYETATSIINSSISRLEARFQKGFDIFCHIILDSSDTEKDAPVEVFLRNDPHAPKALVYSTSIWEAKPGMYWHEGEFYIYAGDSVVKPHVIEDDEDTSKYDVDRIVKVPMELYDIFKGDIELALQEKAGIFLMSTGRFLDASKILPCVTLPREYPDEIMAEFGAKGSPYIEALSTIIESLPKDKCMFGRLDLGISNDAAGFSIGYITDMKEINFDGVIKYDISCVVPIATRFTRYPGEETDIDALVELIIYIHSRRPFYSFSTDTYQSYQIRQELTKAGINAHFLSVDRTDVPYLTLKSALYKEKVQLPKNDILVTELKHLHREGTKIDHPDVLNANGDIGSNSKDTCLYYNTKLYLLSGDELTIEELYNQWTPDYDDWVMACDVDNEDIIPVKILNVLDKGIRSDLLKIGLDNGESVIVTSDQLILLKSGEYKRADELKVSDHLMPFNYGEGYANEYSYDTYRWTSNPFTIQDFQKLCNYLVQLGVITNGDLYGITYNRLITCGIPIENHQVTYIEKVDSGNHHVYDLVLDKIHNYGIASGIFVHNCDAVCGMVYEMITAPPEAMDVPLVSASQIQETYNKALDELTELKRKRELMFGYLTM